MTRLLAAFLFAALAVTSANAEDAATPTSATMVLTVINGDSIPVVTQIIFPSKEACETASRKMWGSNSLTRTIHYDPVCVVDAYSSGGE